MAKSYKKGRMYGRKNKGTGLGRIAGTTNPNKLNFGQGHIGTSKFGGGGGAGAPMRPGAYAAKAKDFGGYGGV